MSGSKSRSSGGDDELPFKKIIWQSSGHFPTGGKAEHVLRKKKRSLKKKTRGGMKPLKSRTPGR
jgi:hypothetical protein